MGFAEAGNIALNLSFQFASSEGTFGPFGFDGLEAFVAVVPDAQRDAIPVERVLGRVEINRDQIFFLRWLSVQSPSGFQLLEVLRSHDELQFGLNALHDLCVRQYVMPQTDQTIAAAL